MQSTAFALPALVGAQYVFSSVLSETADTVLYCATQKDMRREVVVETLRPHLAGDAERVQAFLAKAHAQACMSGGGVASALELFYAEGTWHLAKERIGGIPLDVMKESGRLLSACDICELMQQLCHICISMDIEGIAAEPFQLRYIYYQSPNFRMRNPAVGGVRERTFSRRVLTAAAAELIGLVDLCSPNAAELCDILNRMQYPGNWTPLSPLYYDEELVRLQQHCCETHC
ncbi:MAG: hypothetical protein IKZ07_02955 [Akkermansia sp.]|nr:hypothetical protein [Akkermansia sp.]